FAGDVGGAVRRGVVHDDHLERLADLAGRGEHRGQGRPDVAILVVGRDHERDGGSSRSVAARFSHHTPPRSLALPGNASATAPRSFISKRRGASKTRVPPQSEGTRKSSGPGVAGHFFSQRADRPLTNFSASAASLSSPRSFRNSLVLTTAQSRSRTASSRF